MEEVNKIFLIGCLPVFTVVLIQLIFTQISNPENVTSSVLRV